MFRSDDIDELQDAPRERLEYAAEAVEKKAEKKSEPKAEKKAEEAAPVEPAVAPLPDPRMVTRMRCSNQRTRYASPPTLTQPSSPGRDDPVLEGEDHCLDPVPQPVSALLSYRGSGMRSRITYALKD